MQISPAVSPAPATAFVRQNADVLRQMGATSVDATGDRTVAITFPSASQAANANALLKEHVRGAELLVQSSKPSTGHARPSVSGIVDLLEGVKALEVYDIADGDGGEITAVSFDRAVVKSLQSMVDETPLPGVTVSIPSEPA